MNLCGAGIGGITDHEFVFRFPDEELSVSSRKKKSSASSVASRRDKSPVSLRRQSSASSRHSGRYSRGQSAASVASTLSPASRHTHEKQRPKNRSHSRGMKSSSILTKKLESGFNLTWVNGGSKAQAVNLSSNSDKSYLRVRMRSMEPEESENDGAKVNRRDIKIKVRHIAKIGSETESHPFNKTQNTSFVIKMRYNIGEYQKFKFLALSLAERDSVMLAIRSLIDQGKYSHSGSRQTAEQDMRSHQVQVKAVKPLKMSEQRIDLAEEDTDCLNIPVPKSYPSDRKDPPESRDDNGLGRSDDTKRDTAPLNISTSTKLSRSKHPSARMESKEIDNNRKTFGKSRQHHGASRMNSNKQKARTYRSSERQRHHEDFDRPKSSMNDMKDHTLYKDTIESKTIQSQARSALEDADIANFAADFTNPAIGPWCTDDICTASLKDFADSMTGIFDLKDNRKIKDIYAADKRAVAEEYLSGFLSSNSNMGELLSVKDLWNVAAMKHATGKEIKKIQNRARNSSGKATRLMTLRKQMTFEGADTGNTASLQTISSYDDVDRKLKRDTDDCELLYYDSDPEDAKERILERGPRAAIARRNQKMSESKAKRREALDILDTSRFGLGRKWKRLGQDVLSDIIEATKNEKLTLMWHPTQNNENNMPPVCVKVWVEHGVYLNDGSFLLPKLTWLPAHEKKLDSRMLNVSDNNPGCLELLDVCRVRECESIDRKLHPFARVDQSFVIQTQNGKYMFEAQSKQERGRIVNGLKLTIARLASLLMLKDLRAVDEFFGGNAVPGEAPIWARGCENNESTGDFP